MAGHDTEAVNAYVSCALYSYGGIIRCAHSLSDICCPAFEFLFHLFFYADQSSQVCFLHELCLSAWSSESVGKFQCCFNCLPVILHTIRYWIQRKEQGSNFQSSSYVLSSGTINLWSGHFSTLAAMAGAGTGAKSDRNHHGFVKSTSASSPAAPTGSCSLSLPR